MRLLATVARQLSDPDVAIMAVCADTRTHSQKMCHIDEALHTSNDKISSLVITNHEVRDRKTETMCYNSLHLVNTIDPTRLQNDTLYLHGDLSAMNINPSYIVILICNDNIIHFVQLKGLRRTFRELSEQCTV